MKSKNTEFNVKITYKKQEPQTGVWSSHYTNQPNLLLLVQRYGLFENAQVFTMVFLCTNNF